MHRTPAPARALFALALTLTWAASTPARAEPAGVQRATLANGLRVVLAPDSMASGVDVAVGHPAGARFERDGQSGITHLTERLAFRGSAHVRDGEHRARVIREGGTLNTSGTADQLFFWQTVPPEALAITLAMEADRMAGLAPTAAAFEEEKREAALDGARAERAPVARGLARLWAEAFAGHPYARPASGLESDLRRLTLADVQRWRRERFAAGSAVLTVTGRFEREATLARIRDLFEKLPRGTRQPAPAVRPLASGTRRAEETLDAPVRVMFTGYRAPGSGEADAPALELLAQLLGSGEGSRLMRVLGEDWPLALAAQAGLDARRDASLFWVLVAVRDEAAPATAEHVLQEELGRIAKEGVSEEEFSRVQRQAETRMLFASQGVRARAQALGEAELLLGDATLSSRRLAAIRSLTAADVQKATERLVEPGPAAIVWSRPAAQGGER